MLGMAAPNREIEAPHPDRKALKYLLWPRLVSGTNASYRAGSVGYGARCGQRPGTRKRGGSAAVCRALHRQGTRTPLLVLRCIVLCVEGDLLPIVLCTCYAMYGTGKIASS
eukprot:3941342-Rhodomonas_salina.4